MKVRISYNYINNKTFGDFLYFVLLTFGFHFFFRYWAAYLDYWPIKNTITEVYSLLSKIVFEQSAVVVGFLLNEKVIISDQQFIFINNGIITIGHACSGLKQMLQFFMLFLFLRGSFFKKYWFIPLGILTIHLTNLFRIISLSVIIIYKTEYWQLSHDYIFRPFFYVIIFIFWVVWVEKMDAKKLKPNIKSS